MFRETRFRPGFVLLPTCLINLTSVKLFCFYEIDLIRKLVSVPQLYEETD
jgi:hypothetical protein